MQMRHNKLSSISSFILILLIVLVSLVCLIIFKNSSVFLSLFAILFVSSAAISVISTTIQLKTTITTDRFFDKLQKIMSYSSRPKRMGPNSDISRVGPGTTVDFPESEPVHEEFHLSLDQYLEINDFKLMPEIMEAIEWKRFELLCNLIFKASGFNSHLTQNGADEGVDIRIFEKNDNQKILYLIQCKHFHRSQKKVDRPLLQQLRGQMAAENVEKGAYCITSKFTVPAQDFAATNDIELFDQDKIIKSFNKLHDTDRKIILRELLEGNYWTPSCATCGEKLQITKLKNGKTVWGCKHSRKHGWTSMYYYEAQPIKNVQPLTVRL